jgi:hypothetical protein
MPLKDIEARRAYDRTRNRHPLYSRWVSMKTRCNNPNATNAPIYGARGIKLCKRWQTFANFLADMGPTFRPGLTIERINNNRGYSPHNCRWATPWEQNRNQRNNVYVETPWGTLLLRDAEAKSGIRYVTLYWRLVNHRPLFAPIRPVGRRTVSKSQ